MDLDEKDKKMLIIIIILLFTIIGLFTYHYFSTKKQNELYEKQKAKEAKELLKKPKEEKEEYPKKEEVINYVKDYMLNNNLADEKTINTWEVTSVKLYKDNNNDYYFTVDGYYKCKQGSKCVDSLATQPNIDGNYDWGMISKYDLNTKSLVEIYSKDKISLEELEEVIKDVE